MNTIKLPYSEIEAEVEATPMLIPDSVIEITENGRYDVKRYVYADVNVEGGGGSSDFSTAEVTMEFIRDSGNQTGRPAVYIPCIESNQGISYITCEPITLPLVVPLYQGNALGSIKNGGGILDSITIVSVSATENIEVFDTDVLIHGDGVITVHYTTGTMN